MKRIVKAAGGLKVRSGPGISYDEMGKVEDGAEVEILENDPVGGVWQRIAGGWVHGGYLVEAHDAPPPRGGVRTAASLLVLLKQVNALAPHRNKAFDGTIASTRHHAQNPTSDHEPNAAGVVTALDVTHDPLGGCDAKALVRSLVASKDPRIKYIIHDGQMWRAYSKPGIPAWHPASYGGPDPHRHHVHLSVSADPALYDDTRAWRVTVA